MKNIVLIGLPGSGKTTVGRALSQRLGIPFIDLDETVEQAAGTTISTYFATYGEEAFRELESTVVQRLQAKQGVVLATGGGTILRKINVDSLKKNGFIIFLDRPIEAICADVKVAHRPLLKEGPQAIRRLSRQRRPLYLKSADWVLGGQLDIEALLGHLAVVHAALAAKGYAVIGDPIAHSLSPQLHGMAFAAQGITEPYTTLHVPRGTLGSFMAAVRRSALKGFNVTRPHKRDILPLLDVVDPGASLCGAVNTVVCRKGSLCGYNTDMEGLSQSLKQADQYFAMRRVTILGAGGSAVAAAVKAGLEGACSIQVAARDAEKSEALARQVAEATHVAVNGTGWEAGILEEACAATDLLLNATPLGMEGYPENFDDYNFLDALPTGSFVCDLIYTPAETELLRQARKRGLATLNGLGMLIFQALLAEELFLETKLDKPAIYQTIRDVLSPTEKELET